MIDEKGFSYIEILLSVTLITVLAGIAIPIYYFFLTRNSLNVSVDIISQTLRRSETLSRATDGDTSWGVKIQIGSVVLFKGASYAARDANYDEIFDTALTIIPSGLQEIVFSKFTGFPQTAGTITLTANNETRNIIINEKGTITY